MKNTSLSIILLLVCTVAINRAKGAAVHPPRYDDGSPSMVYNQLQSVAPGNRTIRSSSNGMDQELSYFKLRLSKKDMFGRWIYIASDLSGSDSSFLPFTDSRVGDDLYVTWPDRSDLNENIFYFSTVSGSKIYDSFLKIRNFQCGNVVADGVQNDDFLKVSWKGSLPKGLIFELIPIRHFVPITYNIMCHVPAREPDPTASAVTTNSDSNRKYFIRFCGDQNLHLQDHWIDFGSDEKYTSYLSGSGQYSLKDVAPLPDLDQYKTFYMRTRTPYGTKTHTDTFGVAFRSGQCGNIKFSLSEAKTYSSMPIYFDVKFTVTGPVPDETVLTFFYSENIVKKRKFYIEYACDSDATLSCPSIPMRPELSYFKIGVSEIPPGLRSKTWMIMLGDPSISWSYLPITETSVLEYVRWPERSDLQDNVFYFATTSTVKFVVNFNVQNSQCANVILEEVGGVNVLNRWLKVSWSGALPQGVIFEIVTKKESPVSYDVICNVEEVTSEKTTAPEPTTSAVTTTVMPTTTAVTTAVVTTKEPEPTTSAVTTT
eukprot:Nk52_evm1s2011 gene=Nk52_evmTU1s2011